MTFCILKKKCVDFCFCLTLKIKANCFSFSFVIVFFTFFFPFSFFFLSLICRFVVFFPFFVRPDPTHQHPTHHGGEQTLTERRGGANPEPEGVECEPSPNENECRPPPKGGGRGEPPSHKEAEEMNSGVASFHPNEGNGRATQRRQKKAAPPKGGDPSERRENPKRRGGRSSPLLWVVLFFLPSSLWVMLELAPSSSLTQKKAQPRGLKWKAPPPKAGRCSTTQKERRQHHPKWVVVPFCLLPSGGAAFICLLRVGRLFAFI